MTNKKSGFTLIELLVVIAIIGLLSTMSIIALNGARARSRDARRLADVTQMQTALEMYYNDVNAYPGTGSLAAGSTLVNASTTYMTVPTAPTPADGTCGANNSYVYSQTGSPAGSSYTITYCIGSATGSVSAGTHTATPASITNP
jgi:prepilin-type N-terminal cleavage/methylation domain-containing protein